MTVAKGQATMIDSILARFGDQRPTLIGNDQVEEFMGHMRAMAGDEKILEAMSSEYAVDPNFWLSSDNWMSRFRPYTVKEGILHIPVKGVLCHDMPWQFGSYATGYEYIWQAFVRGLEDDGVKGVALAIHSPGGDVAGNYDLVDKMYARKGEKPVTAFAAEGAYSAAYNIASVADKVVVTRTGGVGSIGVLTMHMDYSKMLENVGMKVTMVSAPKGGHKTERQPYVALSPDAEARMQARVDELYEMFVASVSRNRGMDAAAIRDTKALTFGATEAVSLGLADSIASFEDALSAFSTELETYNEEEDQMATPADKTTATAAATAEAEALKTQAFAEGKAEGIKEGMSAAKTRITAITGSDVGKARPKAAASAAMNTDMDAESAVAFLATLDEEKTEATAPVAPVTDDKTDAKNTAQGGKNFDSFMSTNNPNLGGGDDEEADKGAGANSGELEGSALARAAGMGGFRKQPAS
jgi:signal peptide peptidase SppA